MASKAVKAHYKSATDEKDFVLPISATFSSISAEEKASYLSELRANTKALQADINAFLTVKMAEDKAREGADTQVNSSNKRPAQEDLEEENYGEEVQEQDG